MSPHWQTLAKKVGESEECRDEAIRMLRKLPTLSSDLHHALETSDRPLALEVIGTLNLKSFVPDLLSLVPSDRDGFATLALNGMMTTENSAALLRSYKDLLTPQKISQLSTATIVAMLEPLGRRGVQLSRTTLVKLAHDSSPDLRGAALYYLRIMALKHDTYENLDLITELTHAPEAQVRLQAISVSAEILSKAQSRQLTQLKSARELNDLCLREPGSNQKEACLAFLALSVVAQ